MAVNYGGAQQSVQKAVQELADGGSLIQSAASFGGGGTELIQPAAGGGQSFAGGAEATISDWYFEESIAVAFGTQVTADGVAARSLNVALNRNAVVRRLEVELTALPAQAVRLRDAARVRIQSDTTASSVRTVELVADFGALFTVASVGVLLPLSTVEIESVRAWTGLGFDTIDLPLREGDYNSNRAAFNEVRTERLLVRISGVHATADPLDALFVELPDPPSNLELRIDGAAAVWTFNGPVRAGTGGWDANGKRTVDLGPSFAALTGDPDDASAVTFSLQLLSRTPGRLELREPTPGTRDVSYLARSRPGGTEAHDVEFTAEGVQRVSLPVPAWVQRVQRLDLSVSGVLPIERADPPVLPNPATQLSYQSVTITGGAELVLDADRAACARLPSGAGLLEELTAVRVRLRAETGGAEARVVLLAHQPGTGGDPSQPGQPVEGAASAPVTLEPTAAADWVTFAFPQPIELKSEAVPWAAVV
ncbi:MAG TPA: hypothetical protein VFQ45_09875, partial [Longimicrobium sp.]|nr:hypothetical protein [Longimicrobium sp.]